MDSLLKTLKYFSHHTIKCTFQSPSKQVCRGWTSPDNRKKNIEHEITFFMVRLLVKAILFQKNNFICRREVRQLDNFCNNMLRNKYEASISLFLGDQENPIPNQYCNIFIVIFLTLFSVFWVENFRILQGNLVLQICILWQNIVNGC